MTEPCPDKRQVPIVLRRVPRWRKLLRLPVFFLRSYRLWRKTEGRLVSLRRAGAMCWLWLRM